MSDCAALDAKLNTILAKLQTLEAKIEQLETDFNQNIELDITAAIKQAFGV